MKRMRIGMVSLVLLPALLAACGGGSSTQRALTTPRTSPAAASPSASLYAPAIDPVRFTDNVTNRYLPLAPGTILVYEGTRDGVPQHNEVTVTRDTRNILGVRCIVVQDVVTLQGKLIEKTFDWYAQDSTGNVWYFGEDAKEYAAGKVTGTKGSWEAGVAGAQPGIVMEATPKVGDTYRQEYFPGQAEDMAKVLDTSASVAVPTGSYRDVVVTEDFTPLETNKVEHKYFAPGVGFVKGSMIKGGAEETRLVKITKN